MAIPDNEAKAAKVEMALHEMGVDLTALQRQWLEFVFQIADAR